MPSIKEAHDAIITVVENSGGIRIHDIHTFIPFELQIFDILALTQELVDKGQLLAVKYILPKPYIGTRYLILPRGSVVASSN
jgi:hypothetical protein